MPINDTASIPRSLNHANVHKRVKCGTVVGMRYHSDFYKGSLMRARQLLSAPLTLGLFVPLVIFDVCLELYHHTSFRLLGIPLVPRWDYIRIDRHKLSYLTPPQKVFCAYCGYANGLLPYAVKIASESERYWCGIMHKTQKQDSFVVPDHHKNFLAHGDSEAYQRMIEEARASAPQTQETNDQRTRLQE